MPDGPRISVRKRFQRSVNLTADYHSPSAVREFIISPLARDAALRLATGLTNPDGNKAWSLVGPYGSGKSSFAAYFANLIEQDGQRAALRRMRESWSTDTKTLKKQLAQLQTGLLPVAIVGERAPLGQLIVAGLSRTLREHWNVRGRTPAVVTDLENAAAGYEAGKPPTDSAIVEMVVEAARSVARSRRAGEGICLILDEFGKTLEWAALHPSKTDLYLLQLLAEAANRETNAVFGLLTIQHQGIESYAGRLSVHQQREWEKVSGRFETISYLETPRHLVHLVAEAIHCKGDPSGLKSYRQQEKAVRGLSRAAKGALPEEELTECFPLHPAVALLLGPLFRLELGQNERSLFGFLSSREPGGFQEFLPNWHEDPESSDLFSLSQLYDYVLANTKALVSSSAEGRTWGIAEEALRRLPKDARALDAELVKSLALLTMAGPAVGLTANKATLAACSSATQKAAGEALERLQKNSVVVYRSFKASYQLWDGSDLDIGELVKRGRERVLERGDLAGQLQNVHRLPPFIAARHYLETGTLRTFECRFVSAMDHRRLANYSGSADGLIAIVLPEREQTVQKSLKGTEFPGKPVLSLHLDLDTPLVTAVVDYLGAQDALSNTSELENDPVARRAIQEHSLAAWDRLQEFLTRALQADVGGKWHWNGKAVKKFANLPNLASEVLANAYNAAPALHNELLNRRSLSSAAAAARRTLLEAMLLHRDQENLGIEGFPPELSMYLSVIKRTRLHRATRGEWDVRQPTAKSPLKDLWQDFDGFFREFKGDRVSLERFYERFQSPPYGIREGLLPVLLFAYLLVNRERAYLYEDGSFIPAIEKDHVQRFLSRPHTFEVQKLELDAGSSAALHGIHDGLGLPESALGLLPVVRALIQRVAHLSAFAKQTQQVSGPAKKLRAAVLSARDPIQLIKERIPKALELDIKGHALKSQLGPRLQKALASLEGADARVLDEIRALVLQAFGRSSTAVSNFQSLRERAESIDLGTFPVQPLQRVVMVLHDLPYEGDPDDAWLQQFGLALVGKPVLQWRDEDLPIFRAVLFEAAQQFAAAEAGTTAMGVNGNGQPKDTELASIAWLTSSGGYDTAVTRLSPESRQRLQDALPQLQKIAKQQGVPLRDLLAAALIDQGDTKRPEKPEEAFAQSV